MKIVKNQTDDEPYVALDKTVSEVQSDKDHSGAESKESELELIIDIRGESESSTDEGE